MNSSGEKKNHSKVMLWGTRKVTSSQKDVEESCKLFLDDLLGLLECWCSLGASSPWQVEVNGRSKYSLCARQRLSK